MGEVCQPKTTVLVVAALTLQASVNEAMRTVVRGQLGVKLVDAQVDPVDARSHPAVAPAVGSALTELCAADYCLDATVDTVMTLLHYTASNVIEQQATKGADYPNNPYPGELIDPQQFPLFAKASATIFKPDYADASKRGSRLCSRVSGLLRLRCLIRRSCRGAQDAQAWAPRSSAARCPARFAWSRRPYV